MRPPPPPTPRAFLVAALLMFLLPRSSRAENSVTYKYQEYQEMGGRMAVHTQGAHLETDLGPQNRLKVDGVLDSLAGATPNGQPAPLGGDQVPLAEMHERRKAWSTDFAHQFAALNLAVGFANSRESDYVSNGWSLNSLTDFNQKNTTLLLGLAGTSDKINVFYQTPRARKRTKDVIVGVTQLLSPAAAVTVNFSWGRQRGYLSDPYKLVQKDTEIAPGVSLPLTFGENRPDERDKWVAWFNYRRGWNEGRGVLDASYRFYHDTFGTNAHTIDAAWFQRIGRHVILRPGVRFYDQSAADFYRYRLDGTAIVPTAGPPRPEGPFYSSDYRLSAFRTFTYGLKLLWNLSDRWQFDASAERYEMRGRDRVTPQSAYARARILTGGIRCSW